MSASSTFFQNGSNSGSANERGPCRPGTGAGRMRMTLAPRSTIHSSSSIALSTNGSVTTGVGKMRSSKLKVHCSYIHWLSAWITAWVRCGSSARRSSSTLASVGHMSALLMPSSSISLMRGSGEKYASARASASPRMSRRDLPSGLPIRKYSSCRARLGDHLERRVRDVVGDHVLERDLRAPVHLHVLDRAGELLRQVLRERVGRLVHVVVGVVHGEVDDDLGHGVPQESRSTACDHHASTKLVRVQLLANWPALQ